MLREAVEQASRRQDVRDAVSRIYTDLQTEIDTRRPKCEMSGRCCRFDEFGHRLYVTTIELAVFLQSTIATQASPLQTQGGCPFQAGGLCTVHPIRPFGCRIFFCDSTATDWQHTQYERFHAQIKRLHEELNVPYAYMEWRAALRELQLMPEPTKAQPASALSLPQLPL